MKKFLFATLLLPIYCFALGNFDSFPKFDSNYSTGESFYYADVQNSFGRTLAGIGVRYHDDIFGFDATLSGAPTVNDNARMLMFQASVLFYPLEEYWYTSLGPGVSASFLKEGMKILSFISVGIGADYKSAGSGTYFIEGSFLTPADFNWNEVKPSPGFRVGIGF